SASGGASWPGRSEPLGADGAPGRGEGVSAADPPARSSSARSMAFRNLLTGAPSPTSVQPAHGVGGKDEHGDDDDDEGGHAAAGRPHGGPGGHEPLSARALPRRPLAVLEVFHRLVDGPGVDPALAVG